MKEILISIAAMTVVLLVACTTPSSPTVVPTVEVVSASADGGGLAQAGQLDGRKKRRNNEPSPERIEWTPGNVWPIPEPTPCEDDNLMWWRPDCE